MTQKPRKILSAILAIAMLCSLLPAVPLSVLATDTDTEAYEASSRAATTGTYQPLKIKTGTGSAVNGTVDGFNADVIVEGAEPSDKTTLPSKASYFDGSNTTGANNAFVTDAYKSGIAGLPNNGLLIKPTDSNVKFQLADYGGNNSLRLTNAASEGSLTKGALQLETLGAYSKISILGSAANGAATFKATLKYTEGDDTTETFDSRDWGISQSELGTVLNIATPGLYRVKIKSDTSGSGKRDQGYLETYGDGKLGFFLYHFDINADPTRLLKEVVFEQVLNSGASTADNVPRTNIMAISGIVDAAAPAQPNKPAAATNIADDSFTFTWDAVEGATGYRVDVAKDENFTDMLEDYNNKSVPATPTSLTVNGLTAETTYHYRVRAEKTDNGQSMSSPTESVTTSALPAESDADLVGLVLVDSVYTEKVHELNEPLKPGKTDYTATIFSVGKNKQIKITPTTRAAGGKIKINNDTDPIDSGSQTEYGYKMVVGKNNLKLVTTATNGATKTYNIVITCYPSPGAPILDPVSNQFPPTAFSAPHTLTVNATSPDEAMGGYLTYQWYTATSASAYSGTAIQGATGPSYEAPRGEVGSTAYYFCEVKNQFEQGGTNNVNTNNATVTTFAEAATAPTFSKNLSTEEQLAQAELTVEATTTDGGTITYQWYSNTTNSPDNGTAISGETSASYTTPTGTPGTTTYYYCIATNTVGGKTATTASNVASVYTKNNVATITGFSFANPAAIGTVNDAGTIAISVPSGTDVTKLIPTITLGDTKATVTPASDVETNFTSPVDYKVTAEDGTTEKAYKVTVTQLANTSLSGLTLKNGETALDFGFKPETATYDVSLDNSVANVTLTPTVANPDTVTVTVNDKTVASGAASEAIALTVGENIVTVKITEKNASSNSKTYTLTLTRATDATLSDLTVDKGTLSPSFASDKLNYTASVDFSQEDILVTPKLPTDSKATVTVTLNGTAADVTKPLNLKVGRNEITVTVKPEVGAEKVYTLIIIRAEDSSLSGLTTSNGTLDPVFASDKTDYKVKVENKITSINVTPAVSAEGATVTVNGTTVESGKPSASLPLTPGDNTIKVIVTATDGTKKSYTLTVTRAASSDLSLTGLTTNQGGFDQTFNQAVYTYTKTVAADVKSITVKPTAKDRNATVKVNGEVVKYGASSDAIYLVEGSNKITVELSATGNAGATSATYTIHVTRTAATHGIDGELEDHNGKAVPKAIVKVYKGSTIGENATGTTITNDKGEFTFTGLPNGVYTIVAVDPEDSTKVVTAIVTVKDGDATAPTLKLPEGKQATAVEIKDNTPNVSAGNLDNMFTAEDKAAATSGSSIEIKLVVEDKTVSLPAADKKVITDALTKSQVVGTYLDAHLLKTTQEAGNPTQTDNTIQPPADQPVTMVIDLPIELRGKASYSIIHSHNGVAKKLTASYDKDLYTLTFDATEFSTFAIVYSEQSDSGSDGGSDSGSNNGSGGGISGGGSSSTGGTYQNTTSTPEHGTVSTTPASPKAGQEVTITTKPESGYVVNEVLVTDANGKKITLDDKGSGVYTFTQPSGKVTIEVTYKKSGTEGQLPFTDVSAQDWFYAGVQFAYEKGLMDGTNATTFQPNMTTTRAMISTIIWRMEGQPTANGTSKYPDVAASQWYTNAIIWGTENGVVKGYGDGTFGPNDLITREQLSAILHRYATFKGYDVSATDALTQFIDSPTPWAVDDVRWAVGAGLISGKGANLLDPTGSATRAETATMLMRFLQNIAK